MNKIDFVYFDAGGGHRSAANALRDAIELGALPWEIRMVNLQEVLAPVDVVRKLTGRSLQDLYNEILRKNWTLFTTPLNSVLQAAIRLYHSRQVELLEKYWRQSPPELVVSLIPHFNRAMLHGLRRISPSIPFVTIMTDIADYSPHFWIEPQEQYLICGSERAAEQALALGFSERLLFKTSGMIIHPRFYQSTSADRKREMLELGLHPGLPTALVMFGGHGSKAMIEILKRLDPLADRLQLIFICGHSQELANTLLKHSGHLRLHVLGFTTQVPHYMRLSDFLIGKPGPGSLSEALALNLPVIVERNASTLPQERYNAQWILEKQVGIVIPSFRLISNAVERMLQPGRLSCFRANAYALNNRAVFEIPSILKEILEGKHQHQDLCSQSCSRPGGRQRIPMEPELMSASFPSSP